MGPDTVLNSYEDCDDGDFDGDGDGDGSADVAGCADAVRIGGNEQCGDGDGDGR